MKFIALIAFLGHVAVLSSSSYGSTCGRGGRQRRGVIQKVDHTDSSYWLGVPEGDGPFPLLVAFHGDEGHPDNMKGLWEGLWSERKDFIFMAPQCPASMCMKGMTNTWSNGQHDGSARQLEWVMSAISDISVKYNVANAQIYGIGYSGGAIFLAYHAFKGNVDVFAGLNISCGGANESEEQIYEDHPRGCKIPLRISLSMSDTGDMWYLKQGSKNFQTIAEKHGHVVDFDDTQCNGHCCDIFGRARAHWEWFLKLGPKCNGNFTPNKCYGYNDVTGGGVVTGSGTTASRPHVQASTGGSNGSTVSTVGLGPFEV
eukprot:GEMP01045885.1.p1 GENE.GEMP01045885.1~~GEMP01045885.1.p1  ORF type:complete len:314 (+),score=33.48 GEMP01045885.1:107-1048(+)